MNPRSFWRWVAVAGAFGAAAYLARSFVHPNWQPTPPETPPRRRRSPTKATGSKATPDEKRGNGHGRAH
jgi:hypothetical protein